MNDVLKWFGRTSLTAVIWVFILSINVKGRALFSYASEFLVYNPLVTMVDETLSDLVTKVYVTAQRTFQDDKDQDERF